MEPKQSLTRVTLLPDAKPFEKFTKRVVRSCCRGHWRPAEDSKLREIVSQCGPRNWNFIAEKLVGRSGKSCRLRWFNQLDPRIKKSPFSEEEEERLLSAHRLYGNKWAMIARFFPGRTDNAVKNHWHVVTSRKQRRQLEPAGHYQTKIKTTSLESVLTDTHISKLLSTDLALGSGCGVTESDGVVEGMSDEKDDSFCERRMRKVDDSNLGENQSSNMFLFDFMEVGDI